MLFYKTQTFTFPNPPIVKDSSGNTYIVFDGVYAEKPGYPALPSVPEHFFLPGKLKKISFEVIEAETIKLSSRIIPQSQPSIISLPVRKDYKTRENPLVYKKDRIFPDKPLVVVKDHESGNFHSLELKIYPIQYNPQKNVIIFNKKIRIEMESEEELFIKEKSIEWFYSDSIVPLYLIITPDSLVSYFLPLKIWREQKGFRCKIVPLEYILGNYPGKDDAEKVRNYLKVQFQDSSLVFVLLGGDEGIVPSRIAYAMDCQAGYHPEENDIRADLYFSDLDGTWDLDNDGIYGELEDSIDMYPDVFVGRVPVHDRYEVENFVKKVISYEKQPPSDYLNKYLFLGMILWSDPYTDAGLHKDRIDSLYIPSYINLYKLYESLGNETRTNVLEYMNNGMHLINHDGHGWYTGMWLNSVTYEYLSINDMDNLSNFSRYSILYSIGCWVGAFDFDAVSEHFINGENGGVAIICNSRYGWGSPGNPGFGYSDKFDDEFFKVLFSADHKEIGIVFAESKISFIPYARDTNVFRWIEYELNLLGDPAMPVWTDIPDTFDVSSPEFYSDSSILEIGVSSKSSSIKDAICTLWMDSLLMRTYTDLNGKAIFDLRQIPILPDSLILTVTKNGFLPVQFVLRKESQNILSIDSVWINDSFYGDGDGYLSPGESVQLCISVSNLSAENMEDTFRIYLSTELVKPTDTILPVTVPAEQTTILSCGLYITEDFPPNQSFKIRIQSGYTRTEKLFAVAAPCLELCGSTLLEDTLLGLIIFNSGLKPADHIYVSVSSLNPDELDIISYPESLPGLIPSSRETLLVAFNASTPLSVYYLAVSLQTDDNYSFYFDLSLFPEDTVFFENFEDSLTEWSVEGEWNRTQRKSMSGKYSLSCTLDTVYHDSMCETLTSRSFIVGHNPVLEFWITYDFATYGVDGLYVYALDGEIWRTLDFIGSGGALDSLYNIGSRWVKMRYNLDFLAPGDTTRLKFVFVSDSDGNVGEGVFLDDILVYNEYPVQENSISPGEFEDKFVSVFPTITRWGFYIKALSENNKWVKLKIYSADGRLAGTKKIYLMKGVNKRYILIPGLKQGIYYIELFNQKRKVVFIK